MKIYSFLIPAKIARMLNTVQAIYQTALAPNKKKN